MRLSEYIWFSQTSNFKEISSPLVKSSIMFNMWKILRSSFRHFQGHRKIKTYASVWNGTHAFPLSRLRQNRRHPLHRPFKHFFSIHRTLKTILPDLQSRATKRLNTILSLPQSLNENPLKDTSKKRQLEILKHINEMVVRIKLTQILVLVRDNRYYTSIHWV